MSNFYRNNRQNNYEYYESYGGLSPIRRRNGNQGPGSPFRTSNNYYSGLQNQGRSPIRQRYQQEYSTQYESYNSNHINRSPVRSRTPIRNAKSPIRSTTPNQQRSPIRPRTPIRTPKKDIKIQYISNAANQFQRNPQSIKMNQIAKNSNALINTHSQKKSKGGLFNQMLQNICSKGKQNYTEDISSSHYSSYTNDQQVQRKEFEKRNGARISFSALAQQQGIQQIQSVQYYERNSDFIQAISVKNNIKNIPFLANNMSPLAGVRKNLNSHREVEAKPKLTRRISDYPQGYKQEQPFRIFSMQPGQMASDQSPVKNCIYKQKDEFNSPTTQNQSNYQSPMNQECSFQNSTMKKSVKPVSLFNQLIQSIKQENQGLIKCEKQAKQKQNCDRENNVINFLSMKKNNKYATEAIDLRQQAKTFKNQKFYEGEKKPQILDSIQFLLQKINEKPVISQNYHQQSGIDVKISSNLNEESLNMDAYL